MSLPLPSKQVHFIYETRSFATNGKRYRKRAIHGIGRGLHSTIGNKLEHPA